MSRQNVYHNNENELLLTKIDALIQKSRETRKRITGYNGQMGGNMSKYVDLDTPMAPVSPARSRQRGGNMGNYVDLDTPMAPIKSNQRGGNMGQYVDLDTPMAPAHQRGGNMGNYVDLDTPAPPSSNQRGGNMSQYVDLDTPAPQNGGGDEEGIEIIDLTDNDNRGDKETGPKEEFRGVDHINDISNIDFGLEKAEAALSRFDMLGGGCGCGGNKDYPIHTASCGSNSYNRPLRQNRQRRQRGGSSNVVADIDRALGSVDRLLQGF
jgi:hypothetical protein